MPGPRKTKRVVRGEGLITDALSKIKRFVKDNRLVSKSIRHIAPLTGSFAAPVNLGADWVASKGWGKKSSRRGRGTTKISRGLLP